MPLGPFRAPFAPAAASAHLVPALGATVTRVDGDPNARGWELLRKANRTPSELDEAVGCFELAIERGTLLAVANLGDALVAQGRTHEAVAALVKLSGASDDVAGRAHNWLGWYFQTAHLDLTRALSHLEHATRLAPRWGVAWLNLAKALDATGDLQRAASAYGTAIDFGDASDDAFARDRRLQLEMALLLRGERPPPAPESAAADSRAFEIVRDTAARLATPMAFMIRPTQRTSRGVMPAIIGVVVEGRALGACIVDRAPHVLQRDRDGLAFSDSADLLPWLGGLDAAAVTPIDVAMWIFDKLREPDWSWAIAQATPATITLWPCNITVSARAGGGVAIRVGRAAFEVTEVAATLALEGELRAAIAAETARLHTWDLREGSRYRVLAPFGTLARGELATLVQLQIFGRSEYAEYAFEVDAGGQLAGNDAIGVVITGIGESASNLGLGLCVLVLATIGIVVGHARKPERSELLDPTL